VPSAGLAAFTNFPHKKGLRDPNWHKEDADEDPHAHYYHIMRGGKRVCLPAEKIQITELEYQN